MNYIQFSADQDAAFDRLDQSGQFSPAEIREMIGIIEPKNQQISRSEIAPTKEAATRDLGGIACWDCLEEIPAGASCAHIRVAADGKTAKSIG